MRFRRPEIERIFMYAVEFADAYGEFKRRVWQMYVPYQVTERLAHYRAKLMMALAFYCANQRRAER